MSWEKYSEVELERQYDNRAAVPEHEAIFKEWGSRSQSARSKLDSIISLRYGTDERQVLDLFLPNKKQAPLHVFFHGGYWQAMDKSYFSFIAEALVAAGCAVAIVNYRLCPAVGLIEIVEDARAACRWLFYNSKKYGFDCSSLHVSGHSAGGHLVAMLCATAPRVIHPVLSENWITSAIVISGLFDLEPLVGTSVNDKLGLSSSEARFLSPAMLPLCTKPNLLIAVGQHESKEYQRQSFCLKNAWEYGGEYIEVLELGAKNHFTILDELADSSGVLFKFAKANMLKQPTNKC